MPAHPPAALPLLLPGLAELAAVSVEVLQREEGPQAAAAAREEFAPGKRWANAACLIAVCLRRRPRCCRRPGAAPQYNLEWEEVAAVGCAVQNLHLAATCLPGGLCGYWSSWYCCVRDSPELARLLGLAGDDRQAETLGWGCWGCSMSVCATLVCAHAGRGSRPRPFRRCLGFFVLGFCPHTESMRASRGPPSVEWR